MTKLDFAIHLFAQARVLTTGEASRVPVVAMISLLFLAKRAGEWVTGTDLAAAAPTLTPNVILTSTRRAVEAGLLECRPYEGGVNGAREWRITNKGQRIVAKLLSTETPATTA